MNSTESDRLKRLTLIALFSDDGLVDRLVLKGGNALSIAYGISARASFDLDFSMEGQFDPGELTSLASRIEFRLNQALGPAGYVAFDVRLDPKPRRLTPDLAGFWGGYALEFKVIPKRRYDELAGDLPAVRREAIPSRPGGRARFEVDISRHEYCVGKRAVEIDQFTVFVYSPAMMVCEKIRAICQQMATYAEFVKKARAPRARDLFDIHATIERFKVDVLDPECLELLRNMFQAKRVPLNLLREVGNEREFHRQDWNAVRDTVDPRFRLRSFDFYFDSVAALCGKAATALLD